MKRHAVFLGAVLLGFVSALSYAQAPVPFVNQPLIPDATPPGGAQFTLAVNGTGFVSNSVVNWNGNPLATQFVSGSQLTATVPAADIAKASTASVTVVNPAPGGGTSNFVFFSVAANTGNSVAFAPASTLGGFSAPNSVALGDFNGDGNPDLAVTNQSSNTVSILLGDGTGNFTLASSPRTGAAPSPPAVGDFNGDGKLDLAVLDYDGFSVSILLGDGAGNFTLASTPAVGAYPTEAVAGDFNRDGKLDLAVADHLGGTLSILLGDGTGNFTLASSLAVPDPLSIAEGDFNGDGKLDLVTAAYFNASYSILLGDGAGNFTLTSTKSIGSSLYNVAVGDFNGDGKLDLATANFSSNAVSILLGDGGGNFTLASSQTVGNGPQRVVVGDFNGDGKLDLAVDNTVSNTVSILLGDGAGNLTLASSPGTGNHPNYLAVGDFNGDGTLDLVTPNYYDNTVSIVLGVPPGPVVALSPTNLTFGTQLIGTSSSPQTVTLTNTGGAVLSISKIAASWNFAQTNNCGSSVPPNGHCVIHVAFTPHSRYGHTGAITITDNAPTSPQTVSMTGVGTAVSLAPLSLNFGSQTVGTTSQPQTVTLTNHATATLSIGKMQINPNFAQTNNCGTSLAAGRSCNISVTFTPLRKGSGTVPLVIYDNGGASPQIVLVSGTGT